MRSRGSLILLCMLAGLGGCGATQHQTPRAFSETNVKPAPRSAEAENPEPAVLAISRDIRDACGISDPRAFFAYNSAQLTQRDQGLLEQLAACFMTGPLKGRTMRLVGYADPRGDEDYNYLLGQRRADRARDAIVSAGLADALVSTTSRGENEATGQDETGWAADRRVEVLLGDDVI